MSSPAKRFKTKIPFQILLAGFLLSLLLLPMLWAFQIIRTQGYSVVREPMRIQVGTDVLGGGLRAFKAVPLGMDASEKETTADSDSGRLFFRVLPISPRSRARNISIRTGGYDWRVGLDGSNSGGRPGHRFAEAIFLDDSGNSNSYQEGKVKPDLIVVNWQDPAGWLRSTFRFYLPVEAAFLGFGLALLPWFLWTRRRVVLAAPRSWKWRIWKIPLALSVVVLLGHFLVPRWIPAVLTYLTILSIWIGVGIGHLPTGKPLPRPPTWHLLIVILLILAGFTTKVRLSDWGFPLVLHTDEYAVVDPAATLSRDGGLNPKEFERPNHPSIYLETVVAQATSEILFGQPLHEVFEQHEALWHQVGRILSAFWGAFLAFAIWAGLRKFDPVAALVACALATVFPAVLQNSAFASPDVSQACLVALFGWFLSRHVSDRDPRTLALAALVAALATGEKFSGAVLLPVLILGACGANNWKDLISTALRASIAYFLLLFLTCPFVFIKAHLVLISVITESRPTHPGADGLGLWGNLGFYLETWRQDASILMTIAVLPGAWRLLNKGKSALPLFTGLVFLASLASLPLHWSRWELPFLPMLIQCSAMGLAIPWTRARTVSPTSRLIWIATGIALVVLPMSHQLLRCVQISRLTMARDTRTDALEWSRLAGLDTSNTLVGHYTGLAPVWKRGFDLASASRDSNYMRNRKWAMVSSNHYQRYFSDTSRFADEVGFWRKLLNGNQVARFDPVPLRIELHGETDWSDLPRALRFLSQDFSSVRTGPVIRVFRIPEVPVDLPISGART